MSRTLSADWVLPVEGEPIQNGAVVIEAGRITAVGSASELGEAECFEDAVIITGFVNAHIHVEYAVYGGFGDALADFADWITLHTERKWRIGWDDYLAIARAGAAENLASGVTTIGDCSYSGAAAVACAELGLRAIVYLEVFGDDPAASLARMAENRARAEDSFSDRVRPGVSPHTPFTVSLEVYRACAELGLPMATHISESASEVAYVTAGDGEEIALLAASDVAIAHCPRSNAILGCGMAPLAEFREARMRVGIGTDSPASAPSFDFFDELRSVVLTARVRAGRPNVLATSEALELATLGSARALGLDDEVGSLAPGKRADLAVVSLSGSPYLPWEDPADAVVLGGSPERIELTVVDGEERYRKGGFEWHELRSGAAAARGRLLGNVPEPTITQKT